MSTYGAVKWMPSPRFGSMAKKPMSACSCVTASTDLPRGIEHHELELHPQPLGEAAREVDRYALCEPGGGFG
jgi:hypothetical protein